MAMGTFINFVNILGPWSRPKQRHLLPAHIEAKLISESFDAVKH